MNAYKIPRGDLSLQAYYDYVGSLPWVWTGAPSFYIDPNEEVVTVDATITGFEQVVITPPPPLPRFIDKADFIARFTPTEYQGIKALRVTDATVDWLMAVLDAARDEINLNSARLSSGLTYIEALPNGPLAVGRVTQILGV